MEVESDPWEGYDCQFDTVTNRVGFHIHLGGSEKHLANLYMSGEPAHVTLDDVNAINIFLSPQYTTVGTMFSLKTIRSIRAKA